MERYLVELPECQVEFMRGSTQKQGFLLVWGRATWLLQRRSGEEFCPDKKIRKPYELQAGVKATGSGKDRMFMRRLDAFDNFD